MRAARHAALVELVEHMAPRPPHHPVPDPIGAASALLFATGVERRQRLLALRFLGVLLAGADDEGRIHCDPDDLVGLGILNDLLPDEVDGSRRLLESVGVLEREPTGWFIKNFAPVGEEVPPADVMAAIGRVLATPANAEARVVPMPPAAERVPEATTAEPARTRSASRWLAAPVGVAAAVLVLALVLSGQVQLPLPGRTVSNSRQNAEQATSTASTAPPGSLPSAPSAPPTPGALTSPSVAQTPPGGATPGSAPIVGVACPLGGVVVNVERVAQEVDSSVPTSAVRASLPPIVRTSVSGVVRNTASVATVVAPFPVEVTFRDPAGTRTQTMTATALSSPTALAPGAAVPWSVVVENPRQTPVAGGAKAGTPTWRWDDAVLAATCPH